MQKNLNLIPVLLTFSFCFFALLSLGVWQLNKNHIKSKNKTNFSQNLAKNALNVNSLDIRFKDFEYIKLEGSFLNKKTIFFQPRTYNGLRGYHQLVPFLVDDQIVMVNRGFTVNKVTDESLAQSTIKGIVIKFPKTSYFELENDLENNKWYTLRKNDIKTHLGLNLVDYIIYQVYDNKNDSLIGVLPNSISEINHLQYALTWFLLASIMSAIFIIKLYKK